MFLDIYFFLKKVFSLKQEQKRALFILLSVCLTAFVQVDTFFAVGSPLGVFLALRNIRIGIGMQVFYMVFYILFQILINLLKKLLLEYWSLYL